MNCLFADVFKRAMKLEQNKTKTKNPTTQQQQQKKIKKNPTFSPSKLGG